MKVFRFAKNIFFIGLTILSNFTNVSSLKCISMSNQPCKATPDIVNVNINNPIFYPFSIKAIECSSNCNNINDPYSKIVCNDKQSWNEDKCTCECKELIEKGVCDKRYIWNPSNCECECD